MNRGGEGGGGGGRNGGQREGFGNGRYGYGDGRTGPRNQVWERSMKQPEENNYHKGQEKQPQQMVGGSGSGKGVESQIQNLNQDKPLNEPVMNKAEVVEAPRREQQRDPVAQGGIQLRGNPGNQNRTPCDKCGLSNHLTKDCRRQYCEFCGLGNHNTYQCRRCVLWNVGPKLCAIQSEDQSFLFIEEDIDPRVAREKETTATITIVKGEATARQVEMEFSNMMGSETWKWKAKPVADNKFTMKFPNVKLLGQWCHFKFLPMECAEALMKVEAWTPCLGAVGMLQQAWFRVHGIPIDQRSVRTIAKVGGLVGKTLEIDDSTRFNPEYVRVRLACMDITKVPRNARCAMGLFIHNFTFEREVELEEGERALKSGIIVSKQTSPSHDGPQCRSGKMMTPSQNDKSVSKFSRMEGGYDNSSRQFSKRLNSAPPKVEYGDEKRAKLMGGAQKSFTHIHSKGVEDKERVKDAINILEQPSTLETDSKSVKKPTSHIKGDVKADQDGDETVKDPQKAVSHLNEDGEAERVHILESFDESDEESDSMNEKLREIGLFTDDNQGCSKDMEVDSNHQLWMALNGPAPNSDINAEGLKKSEKLKILDKADVGKTAVKEEMLKGQNSPEIFISDDQIINTQESEANADPSTEAGMGSDIIQHQDLRRSDRLRGEVTKTTLEKTDTMAKKRNLEGLYPELDREAIEDGVNLMMQVALGIMATMKTEGSDGGDGNADGSI